MAIKPPTVKDVAELAQTSIATVSYVFSKKDRYIKPELRQRVLQAASELGYVKNAVASSLKGSKRGILAVLIPQFSNNFFINICSEIEAVAQKAGYVVIICDSNESVEQEREILKRLVSQKIDGCIVCPAMSMSSNIELLDQHGVPNVVLERTLKSKMPDQDFIGHDNFQSGYLATRKLIEAGHRKIAFIGWTSPIPNLLDRLAGYKAALTNADIAIEERWILLDDLTEKAGHVLADNLPLSELTGLVLAHHHQMAKGTLLSLRRRSVEWPSDLSIVLIGTPEWSDLLYPSIACIRRPEKEMGHAAAALLLKKVKDPRYSQKAKLYPVNFIAGGSIKPISA